MGDPDFHKNTPDDFNIFLSQHSDIYFPNVFLVTVFSHFLQLDFFLKRKTGWASQNSNIPGVKEVTSDEFPKDSAETMTQYYLV